MMRLLLNLMLAGAVCFTAPVFAQTDETLQDIRTAIEVLAGEISGLRGQFLSTATRLGPTEAADLLQRLTTLEAKLGQSIGKLETLEFHLRQVVTEAEGRLAELNRRVTVLEGGEVSQSAPLGTAADAFQSNSPQLATQEQSDFDRALARFKALDYAGAVQRFADFAETYPDGPLTAQARYWQAEALSAQQDWMAAANIYLDIFSGAPEGPVAPSALLGFAKALGAMEQTSQACLTLDELMIRYTEIDTELSVQVDAEKRALACS